MHRAIVQLSRAQSNSTTAQSTELANFQSLGGDLQKMCNPTNRGWTLTRCHNTIHLVPVLNFSKCKKIPSMVLCTESGGVQGSNNDNSCKVAKEEITKGGCRNAKSVLSVQPQCANFVFQKCSIFAPCVQILSGCGDQSQ